MINDTTLNNSNHWIYSEHKMIHSGPFRSISLKSKQIDRNLNLWVIICKIQVWSGSSRSSINNKIQVVEFPCLRALGWKSTPRPSGRLPGWSSNHWCIWHPISSSCYCSRCNSCLMRWPYSDRQQNTSCKLWGLNLKYVKEFVYVALWFTAMCWGSPRTSISGFLWVSIVTMSEKEETQADIKQSSSNRSLSNTIEAGWISHAVYRSSYSSAEKYPEINTISLVSTANQLKQLCSRM